MVSEAQARPGRWPYLVAAGLVLAGTLAFAALLVAPLEGMQRVMMPGTQTVTLDQPGRHTIFYEYRSVIGAVQYRTGGVNPGLVISVVDTATGQPVPVTAVGDAMRYEVPSRAGYSIARFDAPRAGKYAITAAYPAGTSGPSLVLGVGYGWFGGFLGNVALGVAALISTVAAGALISIVTFFRRQESQALRPSRRPRAAA